jgi:hypothetical protein
MAEALTTAERSVGRRWPNSVTKHPQTGLNQAELKRRWSGNRLRGWLPRLGAINAQIPQLPQLPLCSNNVRGW